MELVAEEPHETSVKEGCKKTEVGIIPIDWEVKSLSDCSSRITDGEHLTPKRTKFGYYLLSARNILNGKIDVTDVDYVGEEEYLRIRNRCNPNSGDVLISCSGSIGRVATVPANFNCVMVRSAALIKPNSSKTTGLYIQYYLQSSMGQNQIFASMNQGAQPNLFLNHIESLRLALPPTTTEQKAITTALSDVDTLIIRLNKLITKKKAIKQGAMQQLLRSPKQGGERLAGFEGEWEEKTYGEVFDFLTTASFSREQLSKNEKVKYIHYGDIHTRFNHFIDINKSFLPTISSIAAKKYHLVENGDLVMADASEDYEGVGKSVEVKNADGQLAISGLHTFLLRDKNEVFVDGFKGYIHKFYSVKKDYDKYATGLKVYGLSKNTLKKIVIPIPPKEEQQAIANILSGMEAEMEALEKKKEKYQHIKQGMMQELLTGKTRLV